MRISTATPKTRELLPSRRDTIGRNQGLAGRGHTPHYATVSLVVIRAHDSDSPLTVSGTDSVSFVLIDAQAHHLVNYLLASGVS